LDSSAATSIAAARHLRLFPRWPLRSMTMDEPMSRQGWLASRAATRSTGSARLRRQLRQGLIGRPRPQVDDRRYSMSTQLVVSRDRWLAHAPQLAPDSEAHRSTIPSRGRRLRVSLDSSDLVLVSADGCWGTAARGVS